MVADDAEQGFPPGLYALGFLHFHIFGVLLFAAVTGVFLRVFHERLVGQYMTAGVRPPPGNTFVYATLYAHAYGILEVESLTLGLYYAFFAVLALYAAGAFARRPSLSEAAQRRLSAVLLPKR
jgi:hypothetical protein